MRPTWTGHWLGNRFALNWKTRIACSLLPAVRSWRAAMWICTGWALGWLSALSNVFADSSARPFIPCSRESVASVVKFSWPPDQFGSDTALSAHLSPSARLILFCAQKAAACCQFCQLNPANPRRSLRMFSTQSSFTFSTSIEKGTCSSSHFRASVAFAGSRSVNSYVSHSWYSLLPAFVLTRSASFFGSYQKLPQLSASFEKITVHSS